MRYWREIVIGLLVVILYTSVLQCRNETIAKSLNYESLNDSIKYFKNNLKTLTATKRTLLLNNAELKTLLLTENESLQKLSKEFTKLHSIISFKNNVGIPVVKIELQKDSSKQHSDSATNKFNYSGVVKEKWFGFNYSITPDSLKLTEFKIPNNTVVITGAKRKWFLGKSIITTDITHTNPYINTQSITAAEITIQEPWYKKWYLWLAAGIVGGLLIK